MRRKDVRRGDTQRTEEDERQAGEAGGTVPQGHGLRRLELPWLPDEDHVRSGGIIACLIHPTTNNTP